MEKVKLNIRKSKYSDLNQVYELHLKCFDKSDCWYKTIIAQHINNGYVIENNNIIIGVLLEGDIIALDGNEEFQPSNDIGKKFIEDNQQYSKLFGIIMLCVNPEYQKCGLGKKLISKHIQKNKKLLYLHTRKSNPAQHLYIKMGYKQIGIIKNKYFQPSEDSIFMVFNCFDL